MYLLQCELTILSSKKTATSPNCMELTHSSQTSNLNFFPSKSSTGCVHCLLSSTSWPLYSGPSKLPLAGGHVGNSLHSRASLFKWNFIWEKKHCQCRSIYILFTVWAKHLRERQNKYLYLHQTQRCTDMEHCSTQYCDQFNPLKA